ncbi:MAG: hypothetical protein FWF88_03255 [Peptococcaceae bacterium]|nr:hypothetical protein [Peptococcaceae bacterium]
MIWIRADGNQKMGLGHIMRCLAIADAVRRRGEEAAFVVADECVEGLLTERGFPVVVLNSSWNDMASEVEAMRRLIEIHTIRKLMIDSYAVTPGYLQSLCELAYIVCLDDLNTFHYPCHMLINYNCYYEKFDYPSQYPGVELLLGCRYAPLRDEFRGLPRRIPHREVKSVLVTTGGTDPGNIAGKLTKMAKETRDFRDLEFKIIAGRFNSHIAELRKMAEDYPGVTVRFPDCQIVGPARGSSADNGHMVESKRADSLVSCQLSHDVAVSAGGSTLYELCACGTPTVTFSFTDNQVEGVAYFGGGYMINAGDTRDNETLCLTRMLDGIKRFVSDYELRLELSEKTQGLVDGQGANRIAEKLLTSL